MRNITEKTLIKCIVNYKCLGYFGKCFTPFTSKERNFIIDSLISKGWLYENMNITCIGNDIIKRNIDLLQ